jgi:carbon-monoxide dehydrogenase large subunit
VLPLDEVRFAGEPVVAILARTAADATDAADLVGVEYEPLAAVTDMERALEPGAPLVHAAVPGNLVFHATQQFGDVAGLDHGELIVRGRFRTGRITAVPLEPRGCLAVPEPGHGTLTVWASAQAPHVYRDVVAECLRMPQARVRVLVPDVGGGFGIKIHVYPEDVLVAFLAATAGVPVKWVQRRVESLQADAHCRDQVYELALTVRQSGEFIGLRARVVTDIGAWALPPQGAILQGLGAARVLPGPYRFAAYACDVDVVATNKAPAGAYRGVAQPASVFALERLVDQTAACLGIDPAELRARNALGAEETARPNVNGSPYEGVSFQATLRAALDEIGYDMVRCQQQAGELSGVGIGIALYTEITGLGSAGWRARGIAQIAGYDTARVRVMPDGTVGVTTSVPSIGQGHEVVVAQVVADALGVPLADVRVGRADTDTTPYGTGAFASRGALAGTAAARLAADRVANTLRTIAAEALECDPADIVLSGGLAHPSGVPSRSVTVADLARAAYGLSAAGRPAAHAGLDATSTYDPPPMTFATGCQVALVHVDRETGRVTVLRHVVAHDSGRIINPLMVEGQIQGGVAQGMSTGLDEALVYGLGGPLLTSTLMEYPVPRAAQVPSVEVVHLVSPSPATLEGVRGVGENGVIGAPAALANAIADAIPEIGRNVTELPLADGRLWSVLNRRPLDDGDGGCLATT